MAITINIQDEFTDPLEDVSINVFKDDGVTLVASGKTDVSGNFVCTLALGNYELDIAFPGIVFPPMVDLGIGSTTATFTYTGTYVLSTQPAPAMCTVFGFFMGMDAKPSGSTIIFETIGLNNRAMVAGTDGGSQTGQPLDMGITAEKREIKADQKNGFWQLTVVQGAQVRLYIPDMNYEKVFTVPAQAQVNIVDVIPNMPAYFLGALAKVPTNRSM